MEIRGVRLQRRSLFIILLSCLLLIGKTSFSQEQQDDCPTIDLRSSPDVWLTDYLKKTYNQLDLGYCFAYSAADLISIKQKQKISPTHLAINHFAKISPIGVKFARRLHLISQKVIEGGNSDVTFYLLKSGTQLCRQDAFPIKQFDRWTLVHLYYLFDQQVIHPQSYQYLAKNWSSQYLTFAQFVQELKLKSKQTFEQKLNDLFLKSCGEQLVEIQPFRVRQFYPEDKMNQQDMRDVSIDIMKDLVQSHLTKLQAVQINYGVKILDNTKGLHSSSIIAQKKINNQCHYLIRNTWRTNYENYRKEVFAEKNTSAIWVNAEELFQSVQTMNVVD